MSYLFILFQCFKRRFWWFFATTFLSWRKYTLRSLLNSFLKCFPNWIILKWNGGSLFKENCLCLLFPLLHLPLLQILQSVCVSAISSWWFWPQLTAASCVSAIFPEAFAIVDTVLPPDFPTGLSKLFFLPLLFSYYFIYLSSWKSFILFAPLSLVFSRIHLYSLYLPAWPPSFKLGNYLLYLMSQPMINILMCPLFTFTALKV